MYISSAKAHRSEVSGVRPPLLYHSNGKQFNGVLREMTNLLDYGTLYFEPYRFTGVSNLQPTTGNYQAQEE